MRTVGEPLALTGDSCESLDILAVLVSQSSGLSFCVMLGLEVVGLAIAVVPLIIEFTKAYPETGHALQAVGSNKRTNKLLEEFYGSLRFELSILKLTLTNLLAQLPLTEHQKLRLENEKGFSPSLWTSISKELEQALILRLGHCSTSFDYSMDKILRTLSKVVDDKSLALGQVEAEMVSFIFLNLWYDNHR
jgi:hypothetical protein